jgi:nicotinamidase-related amidase
MRKRALIVIDLQNDYFPGGKWEVEGIEATAANAARLIAAARASGDTVVHVRHEFLSDQAPFFVPGSEGATIHRSVEPAAGEPVVLKHRANGFRGTNLKELLDADGIEEVVICGAMSQMCVDATTRAAADLGYAVTLVHDACAARAQEFNGVAVPARQVHAAFMAALASAYATAVSTEQFLAGAGRTGQ